MKSIILVFLIQLFMWQESFAQTVFAPQGAVWNYEFNFDGDGANYRYEAEKDTLYEGVMCSKVIGQRKNTSGVISLKPTYFYTSGDTVFFYHDSLKSFSPLYIYNVKIGDTITLFPPKKYASSPSIAKFLVTNVDTTIIDGIPLRNVYTKQLDLYYFLPKYTERIGGYSVANIIAIDATKTAMHSEGIRCYRDKEIEEQFYSDKWDCDYVSNSIEEQSLSKSIHIYPNPANQLLFVEIAAQNTKGYMQIISMDGRVLSLQEISGANNKLDLSSISNGLYFLNVTTEQESDSRLISVLH